METTAESLFLDYIVPQTYNSVQFTQIIVFASLLPYSNKYDIIRITQFIILTIRIRKSFILLPIYANQTQ